MKNIPHDLGVLAKDKEVLLFSNLSLKHLHPLHIGTSTDGLNFKRLQKSPIILNEHGEKEDTTLCEDLRMSYLDQKYVLLYKRHNAQGDKKLCYAESKDGITWQTVPTTVPFTTTAMFAPNYTYNKQHILYYGDTEIYMAATGDYQTWQINKKPVLSPRYTHFDNHPLTVGSVMNTSDGIVVLYFVQTKKRDNNQYAIGLALFDKKYPTRLLWRSDSPLWEQGDLWQGKTVYPMGAVHFKERLIVYFGIEGEGVHALAFPNLHDIIAGKALKDGPTLEKSPHNPIIRPVLTHIWEASATFNTAAVYEGGKVHFVYRAMGPHNTSVLGYAASSDGEHIDERSDEPIYIPTEPFEVPGRYPSIHYMSGGGYGGCEDPRITKVDDTFYMTYVAYNGIDAPRVALTSIQVEDFVNKRWNKWAKPKLISGPGVVNKNCVVFPEKVNGKYVVIHRIFPNVLMDFVDDLIFDNTYLKGQYSIPPRYDNWDSRKLGAGAPPIKTKDGWLLIYQAVDDRDPGKYKVGAMLLDLNDPTKVLYRSNNPILEPTEWYENEGFKAGVAYPCGAVVMNDRLLVYYGGADTVICAASSPLDTFLDKLKKSGSINKQEQIYPQKVLYAYAN